MKVKVVRTMALFGTPSSVLGGLMIFMSITMTPEWSMSQSLGALSGAGFGSVMFDSGLLMAGSMLMIFSAAFFEFTGGDNIGRLGSAGLLLFGLITSAIGITFIDLGGTRASLIQVALLILPVSIALISVYLYKQGLTTYAILGALATLMGFYPWISGGPVSATQELIVLLPFAVWQLAIGYHMYKLEIPVEENEF